MVLINLSQNGTSLSVEGDIFSGNDFAQDEREQFRGILDGNII